MADPAALQQVLQTARAQAQSLRAQARNSVQTIRAQVQATRSRGGILGGGMLGQLGRGGLGQLGRGGLLGGARGGVMPFSLGFQGAGGVKDQVLARLSTLEANFRQRGMMAAADRLATLASRVRSGALAPGAALGIIGGATGGASVAAPVQAREIGGLDDEQLRGGPNPGIRAVAGL